MRPASHILRLALLPLLLVFAATPLACSEAPWPRVVPTPAPPDPPSVPVAAPAAPAAPAVLAAAPPEVRQVELSPEAIASLVVLLTHYDQVHLALTTDKTDGITTSGVAMAESALAARPLIRDETLAAVLSDLETKGRKLGEGDIEAIRLTYGELSKSLVALVSASAPLREGRFVFECPMARGYQKWIQKEPSLRNPYFGAAMLTCGDESRWAP